MREALNLGHNYIGTEHILLGLVRENDGVATRILLDRFDADAEKIRNEIIRILSGPGRRQVGEGGAAAMTGQGASIDDATRALTIGDLIDSLIAAKGAAIDDQDFERAAATGDLERRLTRLLESISHIIGRDQSTPPEPDD